MKHTPGPWRLKANGAAYDVMVGDGKGTLDSRGMLLARFEPMTREDFEANARLIAAAPEMYEALGKVNGLLSEVGGSIDRLCWCSDDERWFWTVRDKVKATLAKANANVEEGA